MLSDAEGDNPVAGCQPETESFVLEGARKSPGDVAIHKSPRPLKRPRTESKSPSISPSHMRSEAKRPRRNTAPADRPSRSPRAKSPEKDRLCHDSSQDRSRGRSQSHSRSSSRSSSKSGSWSRRRSCSRSQSRSRSRSRNPSRSRSRSQRRSRNLNRSSQSHSRTRSYNHRRSPSARRDRRHSRDLTPPYQRRRPSGSLDAGVTGTNLGDTRRKAIVSEEERKRGQRLFGGLFGGLGQPVSRTRAGPGPGASKGVIRSTGSDFRPSGVSTDRRPDPSRQTEEGREKKAERMADLERTRKIEQVSMDEQKMHALHVNELNLAQSLRTRSKPTLYYRPRRLTEKQKRVIEDQVRNSKRKIEKDLESFEKEKQVRLAALGVQKSPTFTASKLNEPNTVSKEVNMDVPAETDDGDKDRGIIVQSEEDTAIY